MASFVKTIYWIRLKWRKDWSRILYSTDKGMKHTKDTIDDIFVWVFNQTIMKKLMEKHFVYLSNEYGIKWNIIE